MNGENGHRVLPRVEKELKLEKEHAVGVLVKNLTPLRAVVVSMALAITRISLGRTGLLVKLVHLSIAENVSPNATEPLTTVKVTSKSVGNP